MRILPTTPGRTFRAGAHQEQCSFCLRERSEVAALVAAPRASLCDACARRAVEDASLPPAAAGTPYRDAARSACSFCGGGLGDGAIASSHACICAPCLGLARDVLLGQPRAQPARDEYDDRIDAELDALDE
jgi:hypothetical protein